MIRHLNSLSILGRPLLLRLETILVPIANGEPIQSPSRNPPELDFPSFATEHLHIRSKSGAIVPLVFNRAQAFVHERLEAQRTESGRVRALILKGRQQGCSTYVAARFYHRTIH